MEWLAQTFDHLLGLSAKAETLAAGQAAVRALLVYIVLIVIVRFGKKRFLGRATAFDTVLVIIIGSIASRGITANAPLSVSLLAVAALVAIHWVISLISRSSPQFSEMVKGHSTVLIKNGRIDRHALRDAHMSRDDLDEDLRRKGLGSPKDVAEARLERDGKLSVLEK